MQSKLLLCYTSSSFFLVALALPAGPGGGAFFTVCCVCVCVCYSDLPVSSPCPQKCQSPRSQSDSLPANGIPSPRLSPGEFVQWPVGVTSFGDNDKDSIQTVIANFLWCISEKW